MGTTVRETATATAFLVTETGDVLFAVCAHEEGATRENMASGAHAIEADEGDGVRDGREESGGQHNRARGADGAAVDVEPSAGRGANTEPESEVSTAGI